MQGKVGYRFNQIRPDRSVTGTSNFNGQIDFQFSPNASDLTDLKSSFIEARIELTKAANWDFAGGDVGAAFGDSCVSAVTERDGVAQNCFATLFKTARLTINDVEVSRSDEYGKHSTIMKLCYNTTDEEVDSMSPVVPYDYSAVLADYDTANNMTNAKPIIKAGSRIATNARTWSKFERVYKVNAKQDTNSVTSNEGTTQLMLRLALPLSPLFIQQQSEDLPHARLRLSLTVDPDHLSKVQVSDAGAVTMNLHSLFWNVPTYHNAMGPPRSLSFNTQFIEGYASSRVYSDGAIQYSLPSAAVHTVLLSFNLTANTLINDVHQFSGPLHSTSATDDPFLTSLYVHFGSRSYPSPQYSFAKHAEVTRAYWDYRTFTLANTTSTGSVMTLREWMESPVFVFIVEGESGTTSNILTVNSTAAPTLSSGNYTLNLVALYDKELTIEYDENAQVSKTATALLN